MMKVTAIQHAEPTITLEVSLSELKLLRDLFGAFSPKEVKQRFMEQGVGIHPNLGETLIDTAEMFRNQVIRVIDVASPSVKQGV
jgi:hypothetical protein